MPDWSELLAEVNKGSSHDLLRRRYLKKLHEVTGRNVIAYYSAWLEKCDDRTKLATFTINDNDKNGFMNAVHGLDKSKGLDLLLHTPGGDLAAVESLVDYLRSIFGKDMRAIIPQIAMSGGTMIALSCKSIVMGKQSSLGPIDPQFGGIPAHAILEEYQDARKDAQKAPWSVPLWQPIMAKYTPALLGECKKVTQWAETLAEDWLSSGMFQNDGEAKEKIKKIKRELGDHALNLSHNRHISIEKAKDMGLVIEEMEANQDLQDAIMSVHHACALTFSNTPAVRIIENHKGKALIIQQRRVVAQG